MSKRLIIAGLALISVIHAQPALALESPWAVTEQVQGKIITATDSIGAEQDSLDAALQLRMGEGWHTYWRVPGDAGLPPRFDWAGSENVSEVAVSWPAPERVQELDFQTFAYKDEVTFPMLINLKEKGRGAKLVLKTDVMVCKEICIPAVLNVALDVPAGAGETSSGKAIVDFAKKRIPAQDDGALKIEAVVAGPEGLVLSVFSEKGFDGFDVFSVAGDFAFSAVPEVTIDQAEPRKAMIKIPVTEGLGDLSAYLQGKELSITAVSGRNAVEKTIQF